MPKFSTIFVVTLFLALCAGLTFWAFQSRPKDPPVSWEEHDAKVKVLETQAKELSDRVKRLAGHGECASDDQCKAIGLGTKACLSGYKDFLIYSTADTDETLLKEAVRDFNHKIGELRNLLFAVPTCDKKLSKIACVSGMCMPEKN